MLRFGQFHLDERSEHAIETPALRRLCPRGLCLTVEGERKAGVQLRCWRCEGVDVEVEDTETFDIVVSVESQAPEMCITVPQASGLQRFGEPILGGAHRIPCPCSLWVTCLLPFDVFARLHVEVSGICMARNCKMV